MGNERPKCEVCAASMLEAIVTGLECSDLHERLHDEQRSQKVLGARLFAIVDHFTQRGSTANDGSLITNDHDDIPLLPPAMYAPDRWSEKTMPLHNLPKLPPGAMHDSSATVPVVSAGTTSAPIQQMGSVSEQPAHAGRHSRRRACFPLLRLCATMMIIVALVAAIVVSVCLTDDHWYDSEDDPFLVTGR